MDVFLFDEAQVGLIDERGGLQCVALSLTSHEAMRHPPQFFVNQRVQFVERGLISVAPLIEQLSDFVW